MSLTQLTPAAASHRRVRRAAGYSLRSRRGSRLEPKFCSSQGQHHQGTSDMRHRDSRSRGSLLRTPLSAPTLDGSLPDWNEIPRRLLGCRGLGGGDAAEDCAGRLRHIATQRRRIPLWLRARRLRLRDLARQVHRSLLGTLLPPGSAGSTQATPLTESFGPATATHLNKARTTCAELVLRSHSELFLGRQLQLSGCGYAQCLSQPPPSVCAEKALCVDGETHKLA